MENPMHMIYCQQCKNRKLDLSSGMLCSLTNKKPDFKDDCNYFISDPEDKTELKKELKTPNSSIIDLSLKSIISFFIFLIALYRLVRLFFQD